MSIRVMHAPVVRLLVGLAGAAVFVQASQYVSFNGIVAMTVGAVFVIVAGADVAP
jgi:hypothetical protein